MPTVLRVGAYRFYFYSHEQASLRTSMLTAARLQPKSGLRTFRSLARRVTRRRNSGKIQRLVRDNRDELLERWHGFFGTRR